MHQYTISAAHSVLTSCALCTLLHSRSDADSTPYTYTILSSITTNNNNSMQAEALSTVQQAQASHVQTAMSQQRSYWQASTHDLAVWRALHGHLYKGY
jgi:hypothetical protein